MVLDQEWLPLVEKKYLQEGVKKEEKNSPPNHVSNLKKRSEFLFLRKKGKSIKGKFLIINYLKIESDEKKFGLTVSKKIGNAVKRNYIKRVLRSIIMKNLEKIPLGMNFEIIPKKRFEKNSFVDLESDFLKTLEYLVI